MKRATCTTQRSSLMPAPDCPPHKCRSDVTWLGSGPADQARKRRSAVVRFRDSAPADTRAGKHERKSRQAHHPAFARSLSAYFWIFPVLVFGTSVNTTWPGTL